MAGPAADWGIRLQPAPIGPFILIKCILLKVIVDSVYGHFLFVYKNSEINV